MHVGLLREDYVGVWYLLFDNLRFLEVKDLQSTSWPSIWDIMRADEDFNFYD